MFESGMVKLLSGDFNWAHLTALTYHYWTQPLPNMFSWYANQLPLWFQKLSCAVVLGVEIFIPFLIFCGQWGRLISFFGITGLQLLIILTGNYGFFNLLTIGLCLTLLEDKHFIFLNHFFLFLDAHEKQKSEVVPEKTTDSVSEVLQRGVIYDFVTAVLAVCVLFVSIGIMADSFGHLILPKPLEKLITVVSPLRSINNYGLFAIMTTERNEITLEGSNDGEHWLPYEFRYKPGDIRKAPQWAMPYQPRLDWQMWFAALGAWRDNQWLMALMLRLLQGEPSIERLLAVNPFPDHPPQFIQASLWTYHFTDFKTKGPNGPWWHREIQGLYCPTLSLHQ